MKNSFRFLYLTACTSVTLNVVSLVIFAAAPRVSAPASQALSASKVETPSVSTPSVSTPVSTPNVSTEKLPRQTAKPWTGSAEQFEYLNRDQTLRIQSVMNDLKLRSGSVVADIGAGGGWFSVRAARRVAPKGTVYAQEILPKYTQFIADRARREGLKNVRTILGTTTNPNLPANTFDAVLILNAYHEFSAPIVMLRSVYKSMKPNARLAFIERDNPQLRREAQNALAKTGKIKRRVDEQPDKDPNTDDHRLARDIVFREAASVGFVRVLERNLGDDHYLVVVTRR